MGGTCGDCRTWPAQPARLPGQPAFPPRTPARGPTTRKGIPVEIRRRVKQRDGLRCRWCSSARDLEVHHITYRSGGGPDEDWNLITLCTEHHQKAHSDKRLWQPILRAVIWMHYVEGAVVTVPTAQRLLERAA